MLKGKELMVSTLSCFNILGRYNPFSKYQIFNKKNKPSKFETI